MEESELTYEVSGGEAPADTEVDAAAADGDTVVTAHAMRAVPDLTGLPALGDGEYRVHLIDVGTGLAVLVQGADFTMLFDGGSGDDKRGLSSDGNNSRLVAYLWAVHGSSGGSRCVPEGDDWEAPADESEVVINHVFLSHPHEDHGAMLDDVLDCYQVENFWDVGVVNDTVFYQDLIEAIAGEDGLSFHTAIEVTADRAIEVRGEDIDIPDTVTWSTFAENDGIELGAGAMATILFVDAGEHHDFNQNSLVIRVDLGTTSLLLTGDAESGERGDWADAPEGAEEYLIENHSEAIDVDILQVGHHGSTTSSRLGFLEAVSPTWALIGAGPKSYSGVVLPDAAVVDALEALGVQVLRTDLDDDDAPCNGVDRIGTDDHRPGGCDNSVITIGAGE